MVIVKRVNFFFDFSRELATKDSNNIVTFAYPTHCGRLVFSLRAQRGSTILPPPGFLRRSAITISIFGQRCRSKISTVLRGRHQQCQLPNPQSIRNALSMDAAAAWDEVWVSG
jgi:hypothetical protein